MNKFIHDLHVFAIRKAMRVGELEIEVDQLRLELEDVKAIYDVRVTELLEANNRLVEERRERDDEIAKLKAEASTAPLPAAEEPPETWLGIDNEGRVHKSVDGPWSLVRNELIGWLAMGLRPLRQGERFRDG